MTDAAYPRSGTGIRQEVLRIGVTGGLIGGVVIWLYEVVVWVGAMHLMSLAQMPANGTGLVFGKSFQTSGGPVVAGLIGAVIHFGFSAVWGIVFASIWPSFRRRGVEATLVALFFAVFAWIVMHIAVTLVAEAHPDYTDPNVILGGFVSHTVYAVPLALYVKAKMARSR